MSRLYNPGPGEILDRLTILALKITYGKLHGIPITHWEEERGALSTALSSCQVKCIADGGGMLELAAVNAALWQAEDQLRMLRPKLAPLPPWDPVKDAQDVAFHIQSLNDRRAELVTLINTHAGVSRPPDKL